MKYLAVVSYDGSNYSGFQRQDNAIGIQNKIERAFLLMTRENIRIHSAGRTDKGVHAIGQTFHFETNLDLDSKSWIKALKKRLPLDIKILSIKKVKKDFHARHSAKSKVYRYILAKKEPTVFRSRYELYVPNLDIEKIKEGLKLLVGTHDFRGFCKLTTDKETTRTIYKAKLKETKTNYIIEFEGASFLRYQVRSMVGTLIDIGLGKQDINIIKEILETKNRLLASKTAEALALYLVKVKY